MSKIIKKQIRRSLPWFVIMTLIFSTTAIGLVFDLEVRLLNLVDGGAFDMQVPLASAQNNDAASTTVEVRNAPPEFNVDPAENPVSIATSPVNQGSAISFTARGDDPEGAQYYLIVCSSDSVSATNDGEPTCGGTEFCTSGLTNDNTDASCTYTNVTSATEATNWYAFVCDAHISQAECSPSSQGSGDSGSPFYVNHAPTLTVATTSDDFKAPGGTFTFSVTATDPDVARGAGHDEINMYICSAQNWATSTGCVGGTFCTNTGVQGNAITCNWDDTAPTPDQAYTYYAYAEDEFFMPAANNGTSSTYTIINVAPSVDGVNLIPTSGNEIVLNMKGVAEVLVTASTTINNVSDANGCVDIQSATGTIYYSAVDGGANCTADDNDCYVMGTVSCAISDCEADPNADALATVTCTTTMAYHTRPTDISSAFAADTWHASIRAFDENLSGVNSSVAGTDVRTLQALEVTETLIDYGIIRSGQNSGTTTATTTVINYGNCPLDTELYGEDMTQGAQTIPIIYQKHDLNYGFDYNLTGTAATSSPDFNLVDVVIDRPTDQTNLYDNIYWGIGIPVGTLSGVYSGTNTFRSVFDSDGEWN